MAELAPLSHKRNKRIRDITLRNPSGEGLTQEEQDLPFTNFDSADFHEGRAAFIERRTPSSKGSSAVLQRAIQIECFDIR